jgi:thiamine transport system substrate-binding protein
MDEAPTAVVMGNESCFRQIEFAGILAGTKQRKEAEKLVDFILSQQFQEDIPLQMFVFPVNPDAELPELFINYAEVPDTTAIVAPADIESNRETWIEDWTTVVLR